MNKWKIANKYFISTQKVLLDVKVIHSFLSKDSYWAQGIPKEIVEKSIQHSALCFGVYKEVENSQEQVGFARIISDLASFAYLCDVFILPDHRGLGLSKVLMKIITNHPELQKVRRLMLATSDAHQLYAQYGFMPLDTPESFMQIRKKPSELYN
jgi:N-acetylglutamate synthase-like GNAT family acetyltransferase